jgi:hypothetical protein
VFYNFIEMVPYKCAVRIFSHKYLTYVTLVESLCGDGGKNSPTVARACHKRRLKWVLGAQGYNWATQSPGDVNMETWSSRLWVGHGANNPTPEKVNS